MTISYSGQALTPWSSFSQLGHFSASFLFFFLFFLLLPPASSFTISTFLYPVFQFQHLIYLAYLNYNLLLDNMPDSDASEEFNEDVRSSFPIFMCHEMRVSSLQRAGLTFHIWFTGLYCRHWWYSSSWYGSSALRVLRSCFNQRTGISAVDITKLKANGFYTVAVRFSGPLYTFLQDSHYILLVCSWCHAKDSVED